MYIYYCSVSFIHSFFCMREGSFSQQEMMLDKEEQIESLKQLVSSLGGPCVTMEEQAKCQNLRLPFERSLAIQIGIFWGMFVLALHRVANCCVYTVRIVWWMSSDSICSIHTTNSPTRGPVTTQKRTKPWKPNGAPRAHHTCVFFAANLLFP